MGGFDIYAGQTDEERAKLEADQEARAALKEEKKRQLQWQDTLPIEAIQQAALEGGKRPLEGITSRDMDVFEGRWETYSSPYDDNIRYAYARGTYRSESAFQGKGIYRGDFKYLQDKPNGYWTTGTYAMIGTYTRPDGSVDKGIYIAEDVYPNQPLTFYKATPAYLQKVERQYEAQIRQYREEELRRAQAEAAAAADSGSLFSFGQVLSMGLGGLMIATSDIPGTDQLEIGAALFQDVMSGGESSALAEIASNSTGGYPSSTVAPDGGVTGFSSILTGDSSALDAGMAARGTNGGTSSTTGGAGMQAASASPRQSTQYSFTCPSGMSSTVTITYKTSACLSAKQAMTRVYSCNLVDDFASIASQCSSACGSPQCSE
ncbi:hypothetical protein KAJ83_03215 [Marivibrio halodurans]|uniref:Uncharacterized protein n=1 Tax=Marivibrio halodurans TaxID=2039722 RepID=A0A8J7RZN5_9PROT|nr:hypothetical protein [Marivibrio halodurans]MBP5856003.1 hypothetical protein [Marivibrio halodurans]